MNEEFADPRLVAIYDDLNPWSGDNDFYLALAGPEDSRVLDVGCGTGMLACAYARRGLSVTGVDPARAMLERARTREGAGAVRWVESAIADFRCAQRFDLIVMTGHAFQFLHDDIAASRALDVMREHLAPGGRIAFETRNPLVRGWEAWTPERSAQRFESPDAGTVEVTTRVDEVAGEMVRFTMRFHFVASALTLHSTGALRFRPRAAVESLLDDARLRSRRIAGDWGGSGWSRSCPEIIVVASQGPMPPAASR